MAKFKSFGIFQKVVFWKVARLLSIAFLPFMVCTPCFAQKEKNPMLSIERITIDEAENTIKVIYALDDNGLVGEKMADRAKLRLDIRKGDTLFTDVIIRKEEPLAKDKKLLTVQPPLEASIFKTEKSTFILHVLPDSLNTKAEMDAILGSAFKIFDLRPYTHNDVLALLGRAVALFLLLSIILYLIKPLSQKYRFKRNHVMKYLEVREEGKSRIDPFTFVDIGDHDEVVVVDGEVMLLNSWKRLKKLPHSLLRRDYAAFFNQMEDKSFFNPLAKKFGKTDRAWFGLISIFVGWLIYMFFLFWGVGQGNLVTIVFDSGGLQVSTVIAQDLLLGTAVGLCYAIVSAIVDQLRSKNPFSAPYFAKNALLRAAFISMAFFVQALISVFLVQNPIINGGIAWCLIGIAFVFPLDFRADRNRRLVIGFCAGLCGYTIFQLLGIAYLRDAWGVDMPLLVSLSILGCLSSALINSRITKRHILKLRKMKGRNWPLLKNGNPLKQKLVQKEEMDGGGEDKHVLEEIESN